MKSSNSIGAVVVYPTLVGKVIAELRESKGLKQSDIASALQISQPSYSRLEAGGSVLNMSQLRVIANAVGTDPSSIIGQADHLAARLSASGVEVVSEKRDNSAAVVIGLGLLAALLMSK